MKVTTVDFSMELRGQICDFDVVMHPAEPNVGLPRPYAFHIEGRDATGELMVLTTSEKLLIAERARTVLETWEITSSDVGHA